MAAFLYRIERPVAAPPALPDFGPLPACRYDDVLTSRRSLGSWPDTLLDTIYMVTSSYVPNDLVDTSAAGLNGGHRIRRVALDDLTALARAARAAGRPIAVISSYRSYATQGATLARWIDQVGEEEALRRSARPGHSEHQLGTTLDLTHAGGGAAWNYYDWASHPTGAWVRDNAWRYGFVMSYPKGTSSTSCYDYEPWHYRYVGRALAAEITASGLAPRQVLWTLQ
jgi:D-alanyl-D-alanine carboxypeptidase